MSTAATDTLRCYLTATGTNDEQWMSFMPWTLYRDRYLFAANRNVSGRPTIFSVRPRDFALFTFPKPDQLYTIQGEYFQRAQVMAADTDQPVFPAKFHSAISWLGLRFYAAYEAASEVYAHADNEYKLAMGRLESDQLPEITLGEAMV